MVDFAQSDEIDTVMAAIVGFAGLSAALAAAKAGKRLLLANKEALVSAGGLFMNAVREGGPYFCPSIVSTMRCFSAYRATHKLNRK